jgi:hypothetical protein
VPTILQTGEMVFSRDDVAAIRSSGGSQNPQINVDVINNAGVSVQTHQRPDGSIDVVIDAVEGHLAEKASRGRGSLVKAMGTRRSGRAGLHDHRQAL